MKYDKSTAQNKGSEILAHIRELIEKAAMNKDEHFYVNRYVYQRLAIDERKEKTLIKTKFFNDKPQCNFCGKTFASVKGIHLHRKDDSRGYHENNCVLTCEKCHRTEHSKITEPIFDNASTARPKSTSGKHKNIRHLVEELLDKDPNITCEEMKSAVLEEFPTSAFKKTHYSWYINKIIVNGEWKYM